MAEPLRRTSNDADTNTQADRALRRRKGRKSIERAAKSYRAMNEQADRARESMRALMRVYSDVFTETELVEMSPESRPTVRKSVLGKDLEPQTPDGAGTPASENGDKGENGHVDVGSTHGTADAG